MADIVWNLRNDVACNGDIGCADELCNQAADEIERLRQVLENVQQARVLQGKAIIDANNEIERLRESRNMVLEEAAKVAETTFGEGYHSAAAIRALKGTK